MLPAPNAGDVVVWAAVVALLLPLPVAVLGTVGLARLAARLLRRLLRDAADAENLRAA